MSLLLLIVSSLSKHVQSHAQSNQQGQNHRPRCDNCLFGTVAELEVTGIAFGPEIEYLKVFQIYFHSYLLFVVS